MKVQSNVLLADHTSLKVGGLAENLIILEPGDNLQTILATIKTPKLWVIGGGTNSLISDDGLQGTVVINSVGTIRLLNDTTIQADSGVDWDELVKFAISHDLFGIEFMSGIPGTIGGAIVGNVAAYGQKVADILTEISVYDIEAQSTKKIRATDLNFSYRYSNLQQADNSHLIILNATFTLSKQTTSQLEYESALKVATELKITPRSLDDRRTIIMETRRRAGSLLNKTSTEHATAGSFFRNPLVKESQIEKILSFEETNISKEKLLIQNNLHSGDNTRISAAHVLLASGFRRGQTWGKVRLHPNHILKIENIGGATAQDIYDVVEHILATVKLKLNIELIPEVQFLGQFANKNSTINFA